MATTKHPVGTRGEDQNGVVCYVSRVVEVKGTIGTMFRYWTVEADGDKPGTGPLRLLELGAFMAHGEPEKKPKPEPEFVKQWIPECEAVATKGDGR